MIVEKREGSGRHLLPGFSKRLCRNFSYQVGAIRHVGEEHVQFRCTLEVYPPSRQAIRRGKLRKPVRENAFSVSRDFTKKAWENRYVENESTTLT
jgi:hypothetical protein